METQDFSCTAGTANSENFTAADAAANDDVFCVVYEAGAAKIVKKTVHYGGSSAEIEIDVGVKYILKLTAAETQYLATGSTYSFQRIVDGVATELYSGTITVSGSTSDVTEVNLAGSVFSLTKDFTETDDFDTQIPGGMIVTGAKVINPNGDAMTISISDSRGADIVDEQSVSDGSMAYFPSSTLTGLSPSEEDEGTITVTITWGETHTLPATVTVYYV